MLNGTPCVVLEGSGRIADVIAQVSGLPIARITMKHIRYLLEKFFGQEHERFDNREIIKWTKQVS